MIVLIILVFSFVILALAAFNIPSQYQQRMVAGGLALFVLAQILGNSPLLK